MILRLALVLCVFMLTPAAPTSSGAKEVVGALSFVREGFVYVLSINAGSPQKLGPGHAPHLSPNGNLVVYTVSLGWKDRIIAVIDLETGDAKMFALPQRLLQWDAQWSPDGKFLACQGYDKEKSSGRPVLLDPKTGEWLSLPAAGEAKDLHFSSWRPDGKAILAHDMHTLFQIDLTGRIVHSVSIRDINDGSVASSCRFLISPDGSTLIFDDIALPDAETFPQSEAIYAYSLGDKKLLRLTPKGLHATDPMWLNPGVEIIFTGGVAGEGPNLYRLSLSRPKPVCIMRNAEEGAVARRPEQR
ncbi:MAG: WD40 repeat domain-containing protein [Pseudomonadota bacterium]